MPTPDGSDCCGLAGRKRTRWGKGRRHLGVGGLGAVGAILALIAPSVAVAQVHVDPGSPAGKEYTIPLDRARGEFSGGGLDALTGSATDGGDQGSAPLFGEGITPLRSGGAPGTAGTRRPGTGDGPGPDPVTAAALGASLTSPDSGFAARSTIAAVLAVLVFGAALGLVIRRLSRRV